MSTCIGIIPAYVQPGRGCKESAEAIGFTSCWTLWILPLVPLQEILDISIVPANKHLIQVIASVVITVRLVFCQCLAPMFRCEYLAITKKPTPASEQPF